MMYYSPHSCFSFAPQTATRNQNTTQFRNLYRGDCPHFPGLICSRIYNGGQSENGMKRLITAVGLISVFAYQAFADEHSTLARVTVYWHEEMI